MKGRDLALNERRELERFPQVLVLRHVGDDEAERIAPGGFGLGLEADRRVLHVGHALFILGLGLGEEEGFESADILRISPAHVRAVDVNGDEQIARLCVGDPSPVVERDESVGRARHDDFHPARDKRVTQLPGNRQGDGLLRHLRS